MRSLCLVCFLASSAVWAQQGAAVSPPPPPPATDAPLVAPPPPPSEGQPVSASGHEKAKAARFGKYVAGPGGPLFIFNELIAGMVFGGLYGGTGGASAGVYLGVLAGGIILGSLAAIYQYYVPVGYPTAGLTILGSVAGLMFGAGVLTVGNSSYSQAAITTVMLLGSQAAVAGVLAWDRLASEITIDDATFVGMVSGYAFAVTALVMWIAAASTTFNQGELFALLASPAIGMVIGAVLTPFVSLGPGRVLKLTALPLGVGLILLGVGALALTGPNNGAIPPATALVGMTATFILTFLFTSPDEPAPPKVASGPSLSVAPVVALAGRRQDTLAVGPGLVGSF